jgi:hypothetical protein
LGVDVTEEIPQPAAGDDPLSRARGDPHAFADVYERFRLPVFRYLRARVATDDEGGRPLEVGDFEPGGGVILRSASSAPS